MSETIPTFEPKEITIGETLVWRKTVAEHSPADGWALTYYYRGAGTGFDAVGVADGDSFLITVPAATTAAMSAGNYSWQAYVVKAAVTQLADAGNTKAVESFLTVPPETIVDGRSQLKKILDAIDAMVLGKATLDQQEYTIGTRQLKRIPIEELLAMRTHYAKLYSAEKRAERIADGAPYFKNINVRFQNPS